MNTIGDDEEPERDGYFFKEKEEDAGDKPDFAGAAFPTP